MKSRHAKAGSGRTPPLTASAAPGARRAASSASPGRSSVFEGMHAQKSHSPPTRSALDDGHAQASGGEAPRAVLRRWAGADDDDVELVAHAAKHVTAGAAPGFASYLRPNPARPSTWPSTRS